MHSTFPGFPVRLALIPALVLFGAWMGGCRNPVDNRIAESIPERPDLSGFPGVLQNRVARAETRAREGDTRLNGLKELSRLYHANGFLDAASRCYEGLTRVEPENPVWFHRWATITAGFGYLEAALPLWEYVVGLDEKYLPAQIRMGDALLKLNRVEEAETVFREALEMFPENPYALLGKARTFIAREEWEAARGPLEKAARGSDFRIGVDLLASVYRNLGQEDLAQDLLRTTSFGGFIDIEDPWIEDLNEVCYDPYRLATAGGLAEFRGDLEKGVAYMERAVELEPDKALHHFQLGRMRDAQGKLGLAEAHYRKAIDLQEDLADAYVYLIGILDRTGRPGEAEGILFRGYRKCPASPSMRLEMAKYLEAGGMRWKAFEEVDEAIRLRPNEAGAYLLKARMLLEEDRVQEALSTYEEALSAEPGNLVALSALTFHAIQVKDRDRAENFMKRVERHPRMPTDMMTDLENKFSEAFGGES